ncbi:MAG TPA: YpmS family protein [Bacillota bacterium]|nr:YpmS family protein [Bacillota bacterium]
MQRKKIRGERKWKRLFYSLLGFNIAVIFLLLSLIFWPVSPEEERSEFPDLPSSSSEFVIRTTKQNVNNLVNAYLEELLEGSKHRYYIVLDEDVQLVGELPVFSTTVPLNVHFVPFVENGNIVLKQRSISIGQLQLPNKKIMEYMKKYLEVPDWVQILPEREEIYIAVKRMELNSNFTLSAEHIDLEGDHLAFRVKIPYETLELIRKDGN